MKALYDITVNEVEKCQQALEDINKEIEIQKTESKMSKTSKKSKMKR